MRSSTVRVLVILFGIHAATGCSTYNAYRARYRGPDYVVTSDFYREAPQSLAILPFATRSKRVDPRKAEACRRVFYQQMSTRKFSDMELHSCDAALFENGGSAEESHKDEHNLLGRIRRLDAVGMTSLLDLHTVVTGDPLKRQDLEELFHVTSAKLPVSAYLAGVARSYGRLYVVVFSSISVATRIEMRSSQTGVLLWRGQHKDRNYELPITLNPFDFPQRLYSVWSKSRGEAMDALVLGVARDLAGTIPYVAQPSRAYVRPARKKTPYYRRPKVLMFFREGSLSCDDVLELVIEQDGWYQFKRSDGETGWILKQHADLVLKPLKQVGRPGQDD